MYIKSTKLFYWGEGTYLVFWPYGSAAIFDKVTTPLVHILISCKLHKMEIYIIYSDLQNIRAHTVHTNFVSCMAVSQVNNYNEQTLNKI